MVRKRYEAEPLGDHRDTLSEVSVEIVVQNVLRYGTANQAKTRLVYGEYSIGRMGTVWKEGKPIGQVAGWGGDERRRYGLA